MVHLVCKTQFGLIPNQGSVYYRIIIQHHTELWFNFALNHGSNIITISWKKDFRVDWEKVKGWLN